MQLVLTFLNERKEAIRYCESFGYGGKCALDKRFYPSCSGNNSDRTPL
jgi:hypothetical protein